MPAASHASVPEQLKAGLQSSGDQGLVGFYRARENRPLWTDGGTIVPAVRVVAEIVRRAPIDGMATGPALASQIDAAAAKAASGRPDDLAMAELLVSRVWVDYVQTLRRPVSVGMIYAADVRSPAAPFSAEILTEAGKAADLAEHVRKVSELNPVYSQLRAGLAAWQTGGKPMRSAGLADSEAESKLRLNLDRARALPLPADGSFILVDTASARMFLYENGRVRDSMRVVVGKAVEATPMVAGMMRNVVLNPYWNMPPDLVQKRAATVLKKGVGTLGGKTYQILSDWTANPRQLDANSVDWAAVAAGTKELRVRQMPGAGNSMGAMKFNFPNDYGIFLHDTPDKSLFAKADRRLSSGCIRVEDARRLATWVFGRVPTTTSTVPEQVVPLAKAMPVFVTHLTAGWDGQQLTFGQDGYGRDAVGGRVAGAGPAPRTTSSNR